MSSALTDTRRQQRQTATYPKPRQFLRTYVNHLQPRVYAYLVPRIPRVLVRTRELDSQDELSRVFQEHNAGKSGPGLGRLFCTPSLGVGGSGYLLQKLISVHRRRNNSNPSSTSASTRRTMSSSTQNAASRSWRPRPRSFTTRARSTSRPSTPCSPTRSSSPRP